MSMMGRPRKPTALLELQGTFRKDRHSARLETEPVPGGPLGDAPDRMPAGAAALWDELSSIAPRGVLTCADRWLVEAACLVMDRITRGADEKGDYAALNTMLSRMGLTPSDRSKVAVPRQSEEIDELAELASEQIN